MEFNMFQQEMIQIFEKNGISGYIDTETIRKFFVLTERMLETNAVMNITALNTIDKVIPLHYADCVKVAEFIPENAHVADIGCGGGFPILPLAIVRPDLKLVGIDSTAKKVRYVQNVADELQLSVTTVAGRAESQELQEEMREDFDVVISRAVARMNLLSELCIPFVKVGGKFIAMKGAAGEEENVEALRGIHMLGGSTESFHRYDLYLNNAFEQRTVIEIRKFQSTPKMYPRPFSVMKKRPL